MKEPALVDRKALSSRLISPSPNRPASHRHCHYRLFCSTTNVQRAIEDFPRSGTSLGRISSNSFVYKRVHFSVIAVTDIEQPVNLMPNFGSQMGRRIRRREQWIKQMKTVESGGRRRITRGPQTWNQTDFILQ